MINPADNPVGALFERYQTSGAPMPEIEVNMVAGQAHAPIFKAKLSVCEGLVVTATGSSKKIAKNLAAAEMLQKLMNNSSPQLKSLKQEAIDQREEERRGGGEILHQLVSVGRDKVAELGGMTFLEKLAKEQNFELTVIEVEAVEERVEVLAQVVEKQGGTTATVSLGVGANDEEARFKAATTILTYFYTLYTN